MFKFAFFALLYLQAAQGSNIVLTNDDGWAVALVRAQNNALKAAGHDVVLSCPAENESGTGSSTAAATVLTSPCEYDTCPTGSPAEGFNASDPHLNYVNAFPVDSVRYGIQTLAPKFFNGSAPDFVVSGPNVGNNLGSTVLISGTVGTACEAAREGIPSIAFSGATASQVSYTTLESNPDSVDTLAALTYAALSVHFVQALTAAEGTILPPNVSVNVNYPATDNCPDVSNFSFVLSRINEDEGATDVEWCGNTTLPAESNVVKQGCFSSVSVFNASTKGDVDADTQAFVLDRISGILTCLSSGVGGQVANDGVMTMGTVTMMAVAMVVTAMMGMG
ncbi:sure-like protein [Guyanagaster necrorhizus]|uniref:Sure-like protein n=1 Tax=Guyanagaster necrorhizus TaxID=856835 RepID=A0A9P7VUJ4_9AGAR|nr:sure-like protein [Guyanagaster necrorhizus MCA 3950]KAG7447204.1 sure-like protein [Guyanagaster necrorhizus MCA 3950]